MVVSNHLKFFRVSLTNFYTINKLLSVWKTKSVQNNTGHLLFFLEELKWLKSHVGS